MNIPGMLGALLLGFGLSFGASADPMCGQGMRMMDRPMIKAHMARMHENVEKLRTAKSDKERIRLMQEHMEMADEHMMMMGNMMDEGRGPPKEGRGMPCEDDGDKGERDAHRMH